MAALFRMPFAPLTAEPTALASLKTDRPLLQSPRSYHLPAYPDAREWDERQRRQSTGVSGETRIARWDHKREKCANCRHIYLKTLSRHAGYCSVDCKSNAAYIDKVSRTIKAVRSAAEHQRQRDEDADADADADTLAETASQSQSAQTDSDSDEHDAESEGALLARTFAEFGLEARLPTHQNVEWAFSAMY